MASIIPDFSISSGSVELISLDTLIYRSEGRELAAHVERIKSDEGDELFVDLTATSCWNTPKDVPLTTDDKREAAHQIEVLLARQGIKSVLGV